MQYIRGYDIRGIYNQDFDKNNVYHIGCAMGKYILEQNQMIISIGRDNRLSSDEIFENLCYGLLASHGELKIYDLGIVTSPMVSFSTKHLNCYGIMITASHNHISYNGMKFNKPLAEGMDGQEIREIIKNFNLNLSRPCNYYAETFDIKQIYIDHIKQNINFDNLRVSWDFMNAATSNILNNLILKNHNIFLRYDIDNLIESPNPMIDQNLILLKESVLKNKSDIGLVFDGDGDRLRVIDELGNPVSMEHLIMIFAKHLQKSNKNLKIIHDLKCSARLTEYLQNDLNIEVIISAIGHSIIKKSMKLLDGDFSGEVSGHFIFKKLGFDDALYAAFYILHILNEENQTLSEMIKKLPKLYCMESISIKMRVERAIQIINNLLQIVKERSLNYQTIDGIKIFDDNGWILFRRSQTEPLLNICIEGFKEKNLSIKKQERDELIGKLKIYN